MSELQSNLEIKRSVAMSIASGRIGQEIREALIDGLTRADVEHVISEIFADIERIRRGQ